MAEVENVPAAGPAELSVSVREESPGTQVVAVAGELDISNIANLEGGLEQALQEEPQLLVFDLSKLQFMDSSGIALLLKAAERAGAVEVRQPSEILRRIIDSMGLTEILRVKP